MRYAITTGIRHGHQAPVVITGPEVPLNEQREAFLKMRGETEHPNFHKVELWTSDAGIIRKARFSKPVAKTKEKPASKTQGKEKGKTNEPTDNKPTPGSGDKNTGSAPDDKAAGVATKSA